MGLAQDRSTKHVQTAKEHLDFWTCIAKLRKLCLRSTLHTKFAIQEVFGSTMLAAMMSRQKVRVYLHVPLIDPGRDTAQLALTPGTPGVDLPSISQYDCVVCSCNPVRVSQKSFD